MVDAMIAFVTCKSREEATKIAEALVGSHLVACVNVVPGVESCYRWRGMVQWHSECLLVLKTTGDAVGAAHEKVMEVSSSELPEFVAFTVDEGSAPYLQWIQDSVAPSVESAPSDWD
jgi:periplasmic divalent cation tolerance protein